MNRLGFKNLKKCFMEFSDNVSPLKTNFLRANHSKFVIKDVWKAIMLKSKLEIRF